MSNQFNPRPHEYFLAEYDNSLVYVCCQDGLISNLFDIFYDHSFKVSALSSDEWNKQADLQKEFKRKGYPKEYKKFIVWLIQREDMDEVSYRIEELIKQKWKL